jgi:hypothetical protein
MRAWGLWPDVARGTNEPEWGVAYVGGRPSLVTTWSGGGGVAPTSFAVPLRGGADDPGEPIFAPLQRQLGDVPRACTAASASAPRFVAPYSFGTRHAVFVRGEGADLLLATDAAVVHGASATDACASIYEARAVSNELSGPSYSALIAVDAPGTSTLFRIASGAVGVSARAMSCTAAPEPLPKELATIEGFAAPER